MKIHEAKRMTLRRVAGKISMLPAVTAAMSLILAAVSQAALVFDNVTPNAPTNFNSTVSTPNTFMGGAFTLAAGTTNISGFDLYPLNDSGTSYNGLTINIYIWGTVNTTGTVNAATPAFSNLLGTYTFDFYDAGFTTGFYYTFQSATPGVTPGISLATPLAISNTTIGVTFNFQGSLDFGETSGSANNLTSIIASGNPATVGAEVFNGYYRNANSEVDGNFTSAVRSLGLNNQTLAVRIYGNSAATDIGLRAFDGTATVKVACEPAGTVTSKLRISKNGTTYGILMVSPSDSRASKIHIQTSTGVMALQKLP